MSSQSDLNRGPYRLHADWQQTLEGATCLRLIYAKLSQSQQALQFLPPPVAGILFDFFAHCHQALQQLGAVGLRLRVISDDMVPDDDSVTQLFEAIRTQCAGMPAVVHQHLGNDAKGHNTQAAKVEAGIWRPLRFLRIESPDLQIKVPLNERSGGNTGLEGCEFAGNWLTDDKAGCVLLW